MGVKPRYNRYRKTAVHKEDGEVTRAEDKEVTAQYVINFCDAAGFFEALGGREEYSVVDDVRSVRATSPDGKTEIWTQFRPIHSSGTRRGANTNEKES